MEHTQKAPEVSLSQAARNLHMSWERCWRALLSGRLDGRQRNGRWFVTRESVGRLKRTLARPTAARATQRADTKAA